MRWKAWMLVLGSCLCISLSFYESNPVASFVFGSTLGWAIGLLMIWQEGSR